VDVEEEFKEEDDSKDMQQEVMTFLVEGSALPGVMIVPSVLTLPTLSLPPTLDMGGGVVGAARAVIVSLVL